MTIPRFLVPALTLALGLSPALHLTAAETAPIATQVAATHAELAWHSYQAALESAQALKQAITAFAAAPSDTTLAAAKAAWVRAHDAYSPSEVFRFQNGPIDRDGGPETRINGWPLDEQWVDYTIDSPKAGLIAKTELPLSEDLIAEYNEKDGEKNISSGFHAIEFLLWGQDRSATGPGNRPVSDYTTAANADRRRAYLTLAADLLVKDLAKVTAEWNPNTGAFRKAFLADDPQKAIHAVFTGMVMLAGDELSGERLAVAYETQDQEEEQSCFSDTTTSDTVRDIDGIAMVWHGRFGTPGTPGFWQGPSLEQYVAAKNPTAASALNDAIDTALAAAKSIPAPFDQAIQGGNDSPGRKAVLATIEALEAQADSTVAAASAVGVTLDFGANANNAIVGLKEILSNADAVVAATTAGDKAAAKTATDAMFAKWERIETAITAANPLSYKMIESLMEGLKSAAVRAKAPQPDAVKAKRDELAAAIEKVLPLLKK
jgi:putative iron-regulated protein